MVVCSRHGENGAQKARLPTVDNCVRRTISDYESFVIEIDAVSCSVHIFTFEEQVPTEYVLYRNSVVVVVLPCEIFFVNEELWVFTQEIPDNNPEASTGVGADPENRLRNRFVNILPCN